MGIATMRFQINFIFVTALMAIALATLPKVASAQLNQTIQLPTFAFTTVATTVSVPDQGQVLLGGIKRSRTGRNQVGTAPVGLQHPQVAADPVTGASRGQPRAGQGRGLVDQETPPAAGAASRPMSRM